VRLPECAPSQPKTACLSAPFASCRTTKFGRSLSAPTCLTTWLTPVPGRSAGPDGPEPGRGPGAGLAGGDIRGETIPIRFGGALPQRQGCGISSDTRCKIADEDGCGDKLVCGWEGLPTELIRYASNQMATALARRIVTGIKLRSSAKYPW
jgi:hypothetical protein